MAQWFYTKGARVLVTDGKTAEQLAPSIEKLNSFCKEYNAREPKNIFTDPEYVLGGHRESDFIDADLIIKNPGVPRDSKYLTIAREHNIPIENEVTLLFALTPKTPKIAITGTRGKSTT